MGPVAFTRRVLHSRPSCKPLPTLQVLELDACSVEAVACLAAHHFYDEQPEVALRYYRRLLQAGVDTTEVCFL